MFRSVPTWRSRLVATVWICLSIASLARAEEPADESRHRDGGYFNIPAPTLGGLQYWGDELCFHGWRIQRHVVTEHCRLLDEHNVRRAWGSFAQCQTRLQEIIQEENLPRMRGRVVLVLHGLIRTRASMNSLCEHLGKLPDVEVLNLNYPSTRQGVGAHAKALASVIEHLGEDVTEINFVAHSLGALVIRHYLADATDLIRGRRPDPRIRRIVMIAPPNQGSRRAEAWAGNRLFGAVMGKSGRQLAVDWDALKEKLAVPRCEFGIIAGGRGDGQGWKDNLPGDDDGTVSVATTRLPGACDFVLVKRRHTFIMNAREVKEYTARFIQQGCFIAPERRAPIRR